MLESIPDCGMMPAGTEEGPVAGFLCPARLPVPGRGRARSVSAVSRAGAASARFPFYLYHFPMAANPTPTSNPVLLARCHDMARGCAALEVEVGIKHWTAEKMEGRIAAAAEAGQGAGTAHGEMAKRRRVLRAAEKAGRKVITACRLRLTVIFGAAWSAQWQAAGFAQRRTMVPERHGQRLTLLGALAGYFKAHPEHESTDMGATEEVCRAAFEALSDARSAVNLQKSERRGSVRAQRAAWTALRQAMRGLIKELDLLLASDDARWHQFGLQLPARLAAPAPVRRVKLTALGGGVVQVRWPGAPRATRYRVQTRLGEAGEFTSTATVHGTEKLLTGLPPDVRLEVRIIAANAADEAAPGPVVAVTVV